MGYHCKKDVTALPSQHTPHLEAFRRLADPSSVEEDAKIRDLASLSTLTRRRSGCEVGEMSPSSVTEETNLAPSSLFPEYPGQEEGYILLKSPTVQRVNVKLKITDGVTGIV